jgi:hypothetical protein
MVGWKRRLAVCVAAVTLLWGLEAAAECFTNDCRRLGISFGGRQFVFGNASGEQRTFFYSAFEVGSSIVAFEADIAATKDFQLFGPALLLRAPIDLLAHDSGNRQKLYLEPTLAVGPSFWFWKEGNRPVRGVSMRLSPRVRLVYNLSRSVAFSLDLISVEVLPIHYGFTTERKSSHEWVWVSFGLGVYHRF